VDLSDALTFVAERHFGVLMTIQPDGRPHASKIVYGTFDGDEVRVSVTDDRVKTRNLRRDPRAGLFVAGDSPWEWVVVEGDVSLSPTAGTPGDATCQALRAIYRSVQGPHPDWAEFDRAMVGEGRLALSLRPTNAYGQLPG
jgi:PPOX class probable F420-dependent enzyme